MIFFRAAFAKLENLSLLSQTMIQTDSKLSVRRQCQLLGINRSSLYYTPVPTDESKLLLREALMERIDYWHTACPYLGSRKLIIKLHDDGYKVSRNTVRRLQRTMGIRAIYPKANLSKRNQREAIVPYLLRNYDVSYPNQVWSIDITYIALKRGHMYLYTIPITVDTFNSVITDFWTHT